jgi:ferredoxin-nitrite reductase
MNTPDASAAPAPQTLRDGPHVLEGTRCFVPAPIARSNKIEALKADKDGLDVLDDIHRYAAAPEPVRIPDDDAQRMKWYGLFVRKQTPGHMMLRLRAVCGRMTAAQWRVIADLSDEHGRGFCDLTTRQQVQLRWFTIHDVPDLWDRLHTVGLASQQTGMDNVRGVCGCPAAGVTPAELLDATAVAAEFTRLIVGRREFSNLPRKFNVTISGCLDNCTHPETQDLALVPAIKSGVGTPMRGESAVDEPIDAHAEEGLRGFNILVGGKQGSGGFRPADSLDVFVLPDEAPPVCAEIVRIFRDHGPREARNRARMAFLLEERGAAWVRHELETRLGRPLARAGSDQRKTRHTDHVGVYRQKQHGLNHVGLLVPVGRITTRQMRGVADLADRYGNGEIRLTTRQNVVLPDVPDARLGDLTAEPILEELPYNPTPVLRGLISCTGIDYCHLALIETKGWAIEVARRLEEKLGDDAQRVAPLSIHWSGCSAGCGLHQASTIGLQGCRARQRDGHVVDAAHVFVDGACGPGARVGKELMNDVPCEQLAEALLPLVRHFPRPT